MKRPKKTIHVISAGDSVESAMRNAEHTAACSLNGDRAPTRGVFGRIKATPGKDRDDPPRINARVTFVVDD